MKTARKLSKIKRYETIFTRRDAYNYRGEGNNNEEDRYDYNDWYDCLDIAILKRGDGQIEIDGYPYDGTHPKFDYHEVSRASTLYIFLEVGHNAYALHEVIDNFKGKRIFRNKKTTLKIRSY